MAVNLEVGVPLDDTLFDTKAFTTIWTTFWGKAAPECFVEHAVKIPNIRTWVPEDETTFMYLRLPDDTYFPCGVKRILITETYTSFYAELCEEESRWARDKQSILSRSHSTVMTGQPGIGKTTCLSYILVRRLQEKKPTVYCDSRSFAYVFTDTGVQKVSCLNDQSIAALDSIDCCGLVNLNPCLEKIPSQFYLSGFREGRVVVATSPDPVHVTAFNENPAKTYTLPTWEWNDLYCASLITRDGPPMPPDDVHLRDLFMMLRGIPRRVFRSLFFDGEEDERQQISDAVDQITCMQSLDQIVFRDPAFRPIIRTEPTDGKWGKPSSMFLSKSVAGLVYDRISTLSPSAMSRK